MSSLSELMNFCPSLCTWQWKWHIVSNVPFNVSISYCFPWLSTCTCRSQRPVLWLCAAGWILFFYLLLIPGYFVLLFGWLLLGPLTVLLRELWLPHPWARDAQGQVGSMICWNWMIYKVSSNPSHHMIVCKKSMTWSISKANIKWEGCEGAPNSWLLCRNLAHRISSFFPPPDFYMILGACVFQDILLTSTSSIGKVKERWKMGYAFSSSLCQLRISLAPTRKACRIEPVGKKYWWGPGMNVLEILLLVFTTAKLGSSHLSHKHKWLMRPPGPGDVPSPWAAVKPESTKCRAKMWGLIFVSVFIFLGMDFLGKKTFLGGNLHRSHSFVIFPTNHFDSWFFFNFFYFLLQSRFDVVSPH